MLDRIIPSNVMKELAEFGRMAVSLRNQAEAIKAQVTKVIKIGREEGFPDSDIRDLIRQQLLNVGLGGQATFYRYLPSELKDQIKSENRATKNLVIKMITKPDGLSEREWRLFYAPPEQKSKKEMIGDIRALRQQICDIKLEATEKIRALEQENARIKEELRTLKEPTVTNSSAAGFDLTKTYVWDCEKREARVASP